MGLLSGVAFAARAQVKFTASINPEQVNKNEYVTLRLEVENGNNIGHIVPPSLKDFIVVSGPNQETGMSNVNGAVTQYMAWSYILQPKRSGKILMEAATASIAGKNYKTNSLKLIVKNKAGSAYAGASAYSNPFAAIDLLAPAKPAEEFSDYILKKGEQVQDKVKKNMQLCLQTSKTSCFVGEPILATYKLFTRLKSESKLNKSPSFNGFSVIDLQQPDETAYAREKLNGREYNVYTVRKVQLYPLQDGAIELESASLDNNIQFLKAEAGTAVNNVNGFLEGYNFGPDAVVNQMVSLSNKPVNIIVKPLPEAGKPAGFKGAVGKFKIEAALEKNKFNTDEAGKLTLTISGNGNLQLVTAPDINWPRGIETFEPKVKDELELQTIPVSGKKIFEFPFTVDVAGKYQLPSIDFSYFDPALASYKIIHIDPISFSVQKGLHKPVYTADTIVTKIPASFSQQMFTNRGWIVGSIAMMMLAGLFLWIKKESKKSNIKIPIPVMAEGPAEKINPFIKTVNFNLQNPLSKTEDCLNNTDCNQFYNLLYSEMNTWLGYKFLPGEQIINKKAISTAMDKAGIDNDITLQLQQLLQEIEWQLYTPFERNDFMGQLYSRSQSILQVINNFETVTL